MTWSTAKKNRARDNAAAWGDLQNFIVRSPLFPAGVVIGFVGAAGLLIGAVEHMF